MLSWNFYTYNISASSLKRKSKKTKLIVISRHSLMLHILYNNCYLQNGRDSCGRKAGDISKRSHNVVTGKVLTDYPTPCSNWSIDFEGQWFSIDTKFRWRKKAWNGENGRIRRILSAVNEFYTNLCYLKFQNSWSSQASLEGMGWEFAQVHKRSWCTIG